MGTCSSQVVKKTEPMISHPTTVPSYLSFGTFVIECPEYFRFIHCLKGSCISGSSSRGPFSYECSSREEAITAFQELKAQLPDFQQYLCFGYVIMRIPTKIVHMDLVGTTITVVKCENAVNEPYTFNCFTPDEAISAFEELRAEFRQKVLKEVGN